MRQFLPTAIIDAHRHFWTGAGAYGFPDHLPGDYVVGAALPPLRASAFVESDTRCDWTLQSGLEPKLELRFAASLADHLGDCGLVFDPIHAEDRSQTR